jgi:hypothetical protein
MFDFFLNHVADSIYILLSGDWQLLAAFKLYND